MSKTILFGGSGLLGPIFLKVNPEVISIGRSKPPQEVENLHIDLPDFDNLEILDSIDFDRVIFLVGKSDHHRINGHPTMGFDYNVIPLKKILHYMQKRNLKKFIALSTILLYDQNKLSLPVNETQIINPYINDYVFSKYMAEEVSKFYNKIPIINIRLSNIYGQSRLRRPDLIQTLIQDVLAKDEIEIWNDKPERDFIYAEDAGEAVRLLLETDYTGPVNLGTGECHSVGEVVKIIENLSGKKVKNLNKAVTGPMKFICDVSLLKKLTGWKPKYSFQDGLEKTFNIMKNYYIESK